ncbi:MAG: OadG family protein [Clostridia bacterium]|nr:OadG family protein [Clostridia bacterium]
MLTNMSLWMMVAANENMPFIQVFVVGFGTVFVGLFALILIIALLGKVMAGLAAKKAPKAAQAAPAEQPAAPAPAAVEPEPAPEPALEEVEDRQSMVAAISAAIATVMGEDVSGIRILSITRMN